MNYKKKLYDSINTLEKKIDDLNEEFRQMELKELRNFEEKIGLIYPIDVSKLPDCCFVCKHFNPYYGQDQVPVSKMIRKEYSCRRDTKNFLVISYFSKCKIGFERDNNRNHFAVKGTKSFDELIVYYELNQINKKEGKE